ncbi:indole-3-glycerol phosphate synthase [Haloquadratum walsbyi]|jgi:indole-3-glycerol phosphate synthase (EC 4.1.1.48)|uniref:Indole-3-glycerol phosphate synthase n=1 Tax=Haloquadratum walsbyi J07HQW2 TaxID=1238425 RepID=U1NHX3_9EURY|nr:indole-3-glycerol phosphate synthase [Haloquadratum walsbyi]ERG96478.1 MAG: indole-3-glycerol phosphate synthase [Haloquadratum walsbyi J07HQW2]
MDASDESLAPAVQSILAAAKQRTGGTSRCTVDAASFQSAVSTTEAANQIPIIAEIKPTSPTTDGTRNDDPVALASAMVEGGATALSVLTEPEHFGGSVDTLTQVRKAVEVPVLRKDFIIRESQLDTIAADMVLLIARFLDTPETDSLASVYEAAKTRGFQPLVEVHTRDELERAIDIGASIIGINNRDLGRLAVTLQTFEQLAPDVPDDVTLIAESGIKTTEDIKRMRAAGADALLIGTAIMNGDVQTNTTRFTTATDATTETHRS